MPMEVDRKGVPRSTSLRVVIEMVLLAALRNGPAATTLLQTERHALAVVSQAREGRGNWHQSAKGFSTVNILGVQYPWCNSQQSCQRTRSAPAKFPLATISCTAALAVLASARQTRGCILFRHRACCPIVWGSLQKPRMRLETDRIKLWGTLRSYVSFTWQRSPQFLVTRPRRDAITLRKIDQSPTCWWSISVGAATHGEHVIPALAFGKSCLPGRDSQPEGKGNGNARPPIASTIKSCRWICGSWNYATGDYTCESVSKGSKPAEGDFADCSSGKSNERSRHVPIR